MRIDPHRIFFVGDDVGLAGQPRHPEAVRDVGRLEIEKGRRRALRIAQRNMKLVGGDDAEAGIAELPPPLMRDHVDAERVRRPRRRLHRIYGTGRDQDEHQYDEDGDRRPCELDRIAAVDLRRFAAVVGGARAKADDAVSQQSADDQENHAGDRDDEERDGVDLVSGSRDRIEDAARGNLRVRFAHPPVVREGGDGRAADNGNRQAPALHKCVQDFRSSRDRAAADAAAQLQISVRRDD